MDLGIVCKPSGPRVSKKRDASFAAAASEVSPDIIRTLPLPPPARQSAWPIYRPSNRLQRVLRRTVSGLRVGGHTSGHTKARRPLLNFRRFAEAKAESAKLQ